MYSLNEMSDSISNGYMIRPIMDSFRKELLRPLVYSTSDNVSYRSDPSCLPLKKDAQFIPIISVFSSHLSQVTNTGTLEVYRNKVKNAVNILNSQFYKGEMTDLSCMLDSAIEQMYDKILMTENSKFTNNVPLRLTRHHSSALKIREMQEIFTSSTVSKAYGTFKLSKNFLIFPFYYVINDVIVFSMMVKKDRISDFRRTWSGGRVCPDDVEIWIDKNYLENGDKSSFSKWIKDTLIMKLVMKGFQIRVKESINDEIIGRFSIKFNTIAEYQEGKKALSSLILNS